MYRKLAITALALSVALPLAANAKSTRTQYESAHQQAVAAREQAAKVGNQWTTTADVLDAAEKAANSGDYDQATALAQRAQGLAKLAIEQARDNDENWRKAVLD